MRASSIAAGAFCFAMAAATQAMPISGGVVDWSQLPDMVDAEDTVSVHRSFGPVTADNFVSGGQRIIGFHWWGSYFEDAGQGLERDVQFELSFHEHCPAGSADAQCVEPGSGTPYSFGTPKDRTGASYFSTIVAAEEDFFGTTTDGVDIYEYWVRVDSIPGPSFLGGAWEPTAAETYWVDFAWAAGQFGTPFGNDVWGLAKADNTGACILDCAVQTAPGGAANPHIGPWREVGGLDMAFEVIRVSEPTTLTLLAMTLLGLGLSRRRASAG